MKQLLVKSFLLVGLTATAVIKSTLPPTLDDIKQQIIDELNINYLGEITSNIVQQVENYIQDIKNNSTYGYIGHETIIIPMNKKKGPKEEKVRINIEADENKLVEKASITFFTHQPRKNWVIETLYPQNKK